MNDQAPIADLTNVIAEAASVYGVIPDIHPADFVFQHSLSRNPNTRVVAKRYFDRGDYASKKLAEYIKRFSFQGKTVTSVLDFASGYGCVARHFHRYLEESVKVVCCDIHEEAVAFIRDKLQIEAVRSGNKPEDLEVHETFDVIFTLSFFSHMPDATWGLWLKRLTDLLNPGGFILFTTHGYESLRRAAYPLNDFTGFRFSPSSEQRDLDTAEYGFTILSASYAIQHIPLDCRLVYFSEAEWEGYQDAYILTKAP
jgi:SAM-dependent methyltransferase